MSDRLTFHTLDVFTDTPYAGNPLAVVLGAESLSTAQMQTIAREFNLSETIFVMPPRDLANTARVRIFFPTAEIPFAGHPTLGCAVLLAQLQHGTGDFDARVTLEEEAGLVPVTLRCRAGHISGTFTAPVLPHPHPGTAPAALLAQALGLTEAEIGFATHRPGVFQGGPAFVYAPLASRDALARARPMEPHWSALAAQAQVGAVYLYTPDGSGGYCARMFSPTDGIPEDPATGSASAILAAQLLASAALPDGTSKIALTQGAEMGRPSHITLSADVENGTLKEVRISGSAVQMTAGTLLPPLASRA